MKVDALAVLQLVSHCAGRLIPPIMGDVDDESLRIRLVVAYLLDPDGGRYPDRLTRLARVRVRDEADAGDGPVLTLLLLVLEQVARTCTGYPQSPESAGGGEQTNTRPPELGTAELGDSKVAGDSATGSTAPPPAAAGLQRARPCPTDRRTCDRSTCRHFLGPEAPHPCVLELAKHGPLQMPVIAAIMGGISRQRVEQLEQNGLRKLARLQRVDFDEAERGLTHAELAELHAPGRYDIALRGAPEGWRGR